MLKNNSSNCINYLSGSPIRIALMEWQKTNRACVLLDHIPHNDAARVLDSPECKVQLHRNDRRSICLTFEFHVKLSFKYHFWHLLDKHQEKHFDCEKVPFQRNLIQHLNLIPYRIQNVLLVFDRPVIIRLDTATLHNPTLPSTFLT